MKKPKDLKLSEMKKVFSFLMDSRIQNELMNSLESEKQHKDVWMLDYLYDSYLRNELEIYYEEAMLRLKLNKKNKVNKSILKKI